MFRTVGLLVLLGLNVALAQKTKITYITDVGFTGVDNVIAAFEKENPDIDVVVDKFPFNDLFAQIQIRMSARGSDPDVLMVDVPVTAGYAVRGWLAPLDDVFSEEEKADWISAATEAGTYDGVLSSAPISTSTQLLYYNRDLFEQASITPPGPDERWTWQQIAEAAPKLTVDRDGDGAPEVWGFNWEQTIRIYQMQALPASLGASAIGDDGVTVEGVINSPEWVEAFTYYQNMFNELGAAPKNDTVPPGDMFRAGNLAMLVGGPWNLNSYANEPIEFDWGVSRHPYFEGEAVAIPTGSWHVGVSAYSDEPEAAQRLVHFLSTGAGAEMWWRETGNLPAQQSVLELFATDEQFDEPPMSLMKVVADEASENAVPRPVTVGYLEYEQILQDAFSDIRNGSDVQASLDTAASRIQSEMLKYR